MFDGFYGDSHTGAAYEPHIDVYKTRTFVLRKDYETKQIIFPGECYRDDWGNYYHKETAVAKLLSGEFKLEV